jgi:hypothetical protein
MSDDRTLSTLTPEGEEERRRVEVEILEYLLALITASHNQQPRYMDTVALSVRPFAELIVMARRLIGLFDLDTAVGQQLDFTGQWIGLTRFIDVLLDVWFSFDIEGLGWDQGKWMSPYEATTELIELGDEPYRQLLKAKVVANHWDGTIPGAERVWDVLFRGIEGGEDTGFKVILQDGWPHFDPDTHSSMNIIQALMGPMLDRMTWALFAGGYMGVKSAGVGIEFMIQYQGRFAGDPEASIGRPFFGYDTGLDPVLGIVNDYPTDPEHFPPTTVAGWDHGAWGIDAVLEPTFITPMPDAPWDDYTYGRRPPGLPGWFRALPQPGVDPMEGPFEMSREPEEPEETQTEEGTKRNIDGGTF